VSLLLVMLFAPLFDLPTVDAGPVAGTVLFDGDIDAGWGWFEARCPDGEVCGEMSFRVEAEDGQTWNISDRFHAEWLEQVSAGRLTITWLSGSATIQYSVMNGTHELGDAPDDSPLATAPENETLAAAGCSLITECGTSTLEQDGSRWSGVLEDGNDTDVVPLTAADGDVFEIRVDHVRGPVVLEAWTRIDQQPYRLLTHQVANSETRASHVFFSTGSEMVWLKMRSDGVDAVTPYSMLIARHVAAQETEGGEAAAESATVSRDPDGPLGGHLSRTDSGDSVLLSVGAGLPLVIDCNATDVANLTVLDPNSDTILHGGGFGDCPVNIEVPQRIGLLEVRIDGHSTDLAWRLSHSIAGIADGSSLGDAPSAQWTESTNTDYNRNIWPWLNGTTQGVTGGLVADRDIDVWMVHLTDDAWVEAALQAESAACCTLEILRLNQSDGIVLESSSLPIDLMAGTHAIRVTGMSGSVGPYTFDLRAETEPPADQNESFQDLSHLFKPFYIGIGILMLSPWLLVAWWALTGQNRFEEHELKRLARLRQRLAAVTPDGRADDRTIDAALRQLGDTNWDALFAEWGDPAIRHSTDLIEMVAWTLPSQRQTLLIGLKVTGTAWQHAALRCASVAGEAIEIEAVHPTRLHFEDEIDLDVLSSGHQTFLRITFEGEPEAIDLHLSGLVAGEPMAATSTRAIIMEEE